MIKEWKQLKCSICGGELEEKNNKLVCKYCRAVYECVERISEDEVIQLNQATVQRNLLLFDDAAERYELILKSYPNNSEAAWGAFLCSYGIIYEQDYDGSFKPTCHRLNECPVEKSPYYAKLSDSAKARAKEIETLRQSILAQAKSIPPYDVFICYKATDDWHGRNMPTRESNWARDIYEMLTRDMGLKVFFAEKCLSGSNTDYEPHIYSALQSAKLMLVLANSLDHVNAVWVQNEWRRYAKYIREGKSKTIRVIFDQIEPYSLPRELQAKQAISHDSMGWDKQLQVSVEEIFKKEEPKKDSRDEELELLRRQIEELKRAQTASQSAPTPTPSATRQTQSTTPTPTATLPDFEIKNGVLVKYRGKGGKVVIPNTVKAIDEWAFYSCESVSEVLIPSSVTSIGNYAFSQCEGLKIITIPSSITSIGDEAFYGCERLASVTIPSSVTKIGESAFWFCNRLNIKAEASQKPQGWHANWNPDKRPVVWGHKKQTATTAAPSSVTTNQASSDFEIQNGVLVKYKGKGGEVIIPNTVTKIAEKAFEQLSSSTNVVLPDSVHSIDSMAFFFCLGLKSIVIPKSVISIKGFAFALSSGATFYVEAKDKPAGWDDNWNADKCPVVWGYKKQTTATASTPTTSQSTTSTATQSNTTLANSLFSKGWEAHQKKDYKTAVEYYLKACEYNHKVAQNNLGVCYANGYGVPKDHNKAFAYYLKAANQGHALGQHNVGHCYENGWGVPQNYQKAIEYYQKAIQQNNTISYFNLGVLYDRGKGVAQNKATANAYYEKAANSGHVLSQFNLACNYYFDNPPKYEKAVYWFQKAADQGYLHAEHNLSNCYFQGHGVAKDYVKAAALAKKAADKGSVDAQNRMGYHYLYGMGVTKNYTLALKYLNMASEKNMYAQYNLGYCYENGLGVERNLRTALAWYQKSAANGHSSSTEKVNELKRKLGLR